MESIKNTKKKSINIVIYGIVLVCLGMLIGLFVGKIVLNDGKNTLFNKILFFVICLVVFYISMCLHEVGHMLGGMINGLKFVYICFGNLFFVKKDGKTVICNTKLISGLQGKCLMVPKSIDTECSCCIYLLGGVIINALFTIGGLVLSMVSNSDGWMFIIAFIILIVNVYFVLSNVLPMIELNDASKIKIIKNDDISRKIFLNSLWIEKCISCEGYRYKDIPLNLMEVEEDSTNDVVMQMNIYKLFYYLDRKDFFEARELIDMILLKNTCVASYYQEILDVESLFVDIMLDEPKEKVVSFYKKNRKSFLALSDMLFTQRTLHAYYLLLGKTKKASCAKNLFEKISKNYFRNGELDMNIDLMVLDISKLADEIL